MAAGGESIRALRDELTTVDPSLFELYKQLVTRVRNDEEQSQMLHILLWVLFANRPLSLEEMRHTIALAGPTTFDSPSKALIDDWLRNIERLPHTCQLASLIHTRTKGLVEVISYNSSRSSRRRVSGSYKRLESDAVLLESLSSLKEFMFSTKKEGWQSGGSSSDGEVSGESNETSIIGYRYDRSIDHTETRCSRQALIVILLKCLKVKSLVVPTEYKLSTIQLGTSS